MTANGASIRSKVKALLDTVTDIGATHDYERFASDWSVYLDRFEATVGGQKQIRGWTVSVLGPQNVTQAANRLHRKEYEVVIRGYLGLSDGDATEKTAQALAESVVEKLEQYPTLQGVLVNGGVQRDAGLPSVRVGPEPRMFGGVLCHYTEIGALYYEKGAVTYTLS